MPFFEGEPLRLREWAYGRPRGRGGLLWGTGLEPPQYTLWVDPECFAVKTFLYMPKQSCTRLQAGSLVLTWCWVESREVDSTSLPCCQARKIVKQSQWMDRPWSMQKQFVNNAVALVCICRKGWRVVARADGTVANTARSGS